MAHKNIVIKSNNVKNQTTTKSSQFYKGFSTVGADSSSTKVYDYELVKRDLLNQFNTRKGERVMFPNQGTIIWDLIYEPLVPAIKQQISDDIDRILKSDPRIIPTQVDIIEQDYGFYLELTVTYTNTDQTETLRMAFDKELGLMA